MSERESEATETMEMGFFAAMEDTREEPDDIERAKLAALFKVGHLICRCIDQNADYIVRKIEQLELGVRR